MVGHCRPRLHCERDNGGGAQPLPPALAPLSPAALGRRRPHRVAARGYHPFRRRGRGRGGRCEPRGSLDCALSRGADGLAWSLRRSATLIGASSTSITDCTLSINTRASCAALDETIVRRVEP